MREQKFGTNEWNKEFYEIEYQKHLDEGGAAPGRPPVVKKTVL